VSPVHNYATAGTYTAALTVTNASGSSTRTRAGYITVSVPPTPTPAPVVTTTTTTGGFSIGGGGSDSDSGGSTGGTGQQQDGQFAPYQGRATPVNVGGSTPVTGATVYGSGNYGIVVTASERSGSEAAVPLPPGVTVYKYLEIKPAHATTITGAEITFTVPQSWLEEHHMTARDIVMYHLVGASWVALPTTVVKAANGQVYFSATTPSFSLFAITGKSTAAGPVQQNVQTFGDIAGKGPAGQARVPDAKAGPQPTPTAAPAPVPADTGFPLVTIALIGAGCVGLIGGGMLVRRWYIRRQNPALFMEYD
jgi:PGF-pre-PGF domain-containing protein